jgi:hypothetical protein
MKVAEMQWEGMVRGCSARRLAIRRVHLLHLLCPVWAHAPVLLLLHVVGDLGPSARSPFVALHHDGGDLHPPL